MDLVSRSRVCPSLVLVQLGHDLLPNLAVFLKVPNPLTGSTDWVISLLFLKQGWGIGFSLLGRRGGGGKENTPRLLVGIIKIPEAGNDLVLLKVVQNSNGVDDLREVLGKGANESHGGEFIIEII